MNALKACERFTKIMLDDIKKIFDNNRTITIINDRHVIKELLDYCKVQYMWRDERVLYPTRIVVAYRADRKLEFIGVLTDDESVTSLYEEF